MKKIGMIFVVIAFLAVAGITLAASTSPSPTPAYYVYSENPALMALFGVNHKFPGVFSTKLSQTQVGLLKQLGVKTEPVQLYQILPPNNKCGDGVCQGFESPETCPEDCGGGECYPDNQYPWGIVKVNGGSGGSGMRVAVLDTGVDQDHKDLVGNIANCVAFGYTTCEDGHGHGTHVSGTVLANGKIVGVAPATSLLAIKVCSDGGWCYGDDIAAGIYYATDNGAHVISMSLGGDKPDSQIKAAVDYAVNNDVLVVAAAGNDGPGEGSIDYPGAFAEVVAVGAIDSSENVASWSSRGIDDGDDSVISEGEVEFGAPGVSVESTYNDGCYTYKSGTSMATPHVSGLGSKLWQGDAATTRAFLRSIAKDIFTDGYDTATGYGLPIAPAEPKCYSDTDCNDNNLCTIDTCINPGTVDAYCSHAEITTCSTTSDGCCPAGCDNTTDGDCPVTSCDTCFKGVCDGKCNPAQEDATCLDCL